MGSYSVLSSAVLLFGHSGVVLLINGGVGVVHWGVVLLFQGAVGVGEVKFGVVKVGEVKLGVVKVGNVKLGVVNVGKVKLGVVNVGNVKLGVVKVKLGVDHSGLVALLNGSGVIGIEATAAIDSAAAKIIKFSTTNKNLLAKLLTNLTN